MNRSVVALIVGLIASLSVSAQIYQWKDKDGRMHFSDMPPADQPGVRTQTPKREQPPSMAIEPEPDEAETEAAEGVEGGVKPEDTSAQEKSAARQRDEELRKRRAAAEAEEKAKKDAARAAQRQQDCERVRDRHATLVSGEHVAYPTEAGGRKLLNDKERAAEVARASDLIETFCDKD